MRQAMNLNGLFGKGALAARDAYMHRFYPEIDDNDWSVHSPADQLRRLFDGAKADSGQATRGSGGQRDIMPTLHLGVVGRSQCGWSSNHQPQGLGSSLTDPTKPHCVWNLADNVITSRGEAGLLTIMDIANVLRCMNGGDQNRFMFQMSRVLSIARLMEARCQGLFTGLIAAQRQGREEVAKKKKARKEREEMRLELTAAQTDIAKAA